MHFFVHNIHFGGVMVDIKTRNLVIYSFAKKVRKDLLNLYPEEETYSYMNGVYTNRFFDHDYCGACAVASYFLQQGIKKKHNITVDLVSNTAHAFCSIGDYVFDPTYSQYISNKPIYVGPGTKQYHFTNYFMGAEETKEYWARWDEEQNPFSDFHQSKFHSWIKTI